jgi:hypothetical protein
MTKGHFEIVGLVAAGCLLGYVGGTQLDLCGQGEVCGAVLPDLPHEEGGVHHSQPRVMQLPRASMTSWDTAVPQVETNPHHVGRFTPTKLIRFGYNTRGDDPAVVETNPHSIGSFRPTKITKLALLWNNPAADTLANLKTVRSPQPAGARGQRRSRPSSNSSSVGTSTTSSVGFGDGSA